MTTRILLRFKAKVLFFLPVLPEYASTFNCSVPCFPDAGACSLSTRYSEPCFLNYNLSVPPYAKLLPRILTTWLPFSRRRPRRCTSHKEFGVLFDVFFHSTTARVFLEFPYAQRKSPPMLVSLSPFLKIAGFLSVLLRRKAFFNA